jgi:hypothetical protein
MKSETVNIDVDLGVGEGAATGWGCDLSAGVRFDLTRTTTRELGPLVIKIGGSTLGAADTTFRDVAELARRGDIRWSFMAAGRRPTDGSKP